MVVKTLSNRALVFFNVFFLSVQETIRIVNEYKSVERLVLFLTHRGHLVTWELTNMPGREIVQLAPFEQKKLLSHFTIERFVKVSYEFV